jgi:hypothetical protein
MILDFSPRTLANMEIALDRACANIPGAEKHRSRRYIADRIIKCARKGNRSLTALTQAGEIAATELRKRAAAKAKVRSPVSDPEASKPSGSGPSPSSA